MNTILKLLDKALYWLIILIPFSMAIAPAPMNVFMGLTIFTYILKNAFQKKWPIPKTVINLPLFIYFGLTCLSVIYSTDRGDTLNGGILRLLSFSFIFLILSCGLKDKAHIGKIIFSSAAGLILASIDAIWQVSFGKDFIRGYSPILNFGLTRATASFSDANTLGIYLSALAPFVLGMALYYCKGRNKIPAIFVSLIVLCGVLLTYSRPTFLAIYAVLLLFAIVRKDKFLAVVLAVLTLLFPVLLPVSIKGWAKTVNYNPLRFMCNDDRITIYRNSLNMIKSHPIRGVGANGFMKNYKKYKDNPEYNNIVTPDYIYAHNNFLQMAGELGLSGLGIFIWLLYDLFKGCAFIYKRLKDNFLKVVSLSSIACLLAFLVNGLTESSLYYSRLALIFWYLAGFSLGLKKFINADRAG